MEVSLYEDPLLAARMLVDSGFYSAEDAFEVLTEEMFAPGEIHLEWAKSTIDELFRVKLDDQKNWPNVTDCDRLDKAFDEMNSSGIIALQNAGMTQSEGWSDARSAYRSQGGKASGIDGYCFYHGQDLQGVVIRNVLYLAFGAVNQDKVDGIAVGKRIVSILKSHQFEVEWNESFDERIEIRNIDWKRRSDPATI